MKLFVYGLLKRGRSMNYIVQDNKFWGAGSLRGTLYTNGIYPSFVPKGKQMVFGEVYTIGKDQLKQIDAVEFGAGYERKKFNITIGSDIHDCYVYYKDNYNGKKINGGDF